MMTVGPIKQRKARLMFTNIRETKVLAVFVLDRAAAGDKLKNQYNRCDNQQQVNQSAPDLSNKAEQP